MSYLKVNRSILCLIIFCLFCSPIGAAIAEDILKFEVGLRSLPSQKEGNMIRDQDGFLWFCYYGGLARYDGFEVKYFEPGENSISGPAPISIVMDEDGILWILTKDNGLNKYDKDTDTFTHYKHVPGNVNSLSSNISDSFGPQRLFVDRQNRLLIGTMGGLDIFDKSSGTFTHYVHDSQNPNSLSNNNVTSVIQGKDGVIWVGTVGGGLNRFDEKTNTWTNYTYSTSPEKGPASNTIWSLLEDREGTLWIGTWDSGLSRFHKDTETFVHFVHNPDDPTSLGDNKIYYMYEDSAGNIWICHKDSDVAGIEMINKEKTGFIRYSADPKNSSSISTNYVSTVYEDPVTGIFWVINTNAEVFDNYDKESQKFTLHQHDPSNPAGISSSLVLVMTEDSDNQLWLSVVDALNLYDKENGEFTHYPYAELDPQMGNLTIAMCRDEGDIIWLLSIRGVLTKFNTKTREGVEHYKHDPENPNSIMMFTLAGAAIIHDKADPDILWLALSTGLEKFNKKTGTFTHFVHNPANPESITRGAVWSVYDDGKGSLWASTFDGLNKFNKKTEKFTRFVHDPDNSDSIGFNKQSVVYEDSFGNFWVAGFTNGMDLLDRETGVFTHFNKKNGFPATGVNQTIQEDSAGNLWLGTSDIGLIQFDIATRKVINVYNKSDGLQDNHFWRSYKTQDGQMWFGGGFGVNSFFPEKIKKNPYIPPVVLTAFTQGGNEIDLDTAPERLQEVTLGWQENFFEFQFAALNYTNPEKNRYAYKLEGRDKDWYYSGTNPSGRYTGLSGGTYLLRLKGSNNDGVWNESSQPIKIIITPPWWEAWWFYLFLASSLIFVASFTIIYLLRLKREIDERIKAEYDLGKSEEKYRVLIENSPDLHYRTDIEGRIIFVSPSVYKFSGFTIEEAVGMEMAEELYANPEERVELLQILQKIGFVDGFETQLKRKDGSIWWTSTNAHFYRDKHGKIQGVEGVTRDITERKKTEREKENLENRLNQAQKMEAIGTLAGGIAHDFNNILAAMLGYAEMARDDSPSESTVAKDLDKVLEGGNRAKDLVQQILAFSRQDEIERIPLQPASVVKEAIKMLRPSLPTTIGINQDITSITGQILADATQIHQILMNLCTNAFHAMEETGGKLDISLKEVTLSTDDLVHEPKIEPGTFVQLSICDSGPGITSDIKSKIFDPYFTTKKTGKGTGMGLAIVHGIVKSYGGFISLYSELGEGTAFHVFIPVIVSELLPGIEGVEPIPVGLERILFIDDEEILTEMGKSMLERLGYQVTVRNSSIEGLETFKNQPDMFDLVITDQTMPGMTGADIARRMIQMRPDIPIILCTGYSTVISEEKAKSMGIKEFVLKPLSKKTIAVLIRKVLDNS
ncbi:MAG: PAS domain S-box protein [Desulfotalea sp.]